jgi:phosphoserine phosphatase RsbU/P
VVVPAFTVPDLSSLRAQIVDVVSGSAFLFIGLAGFGIALVRRRSGARLFILLGIWSAMYGAIQLSQQAVVVAVLPHWLQSVAPFANTAMTYLIVVAGALCFRELSLGKVRTFMLFIALAGVAIAIGGIAAFVRTGANDTFIPYNNLLAACLLAVLTLVVAVRRFSRKYLVLQNQRVLAVGSLLFAGEALFVNLSRPLGVQSPKLLDHIGFAIFLSSLAYSGLQFVFANERRLLSIENELRIARDIQKTILPDRAPELDHLRVSTTYRPMTAVAGDFYEFLAADRDRLGVLVADVSGHGVPAALFASMIKVAVQSVEPRACDPEAVLSGLNRTLSSQLRGQLISAAYLWLDTEKQQALYSAAGHPPLLRWREGQLDHIVSNGLLFGVNGDGDGYPVCTIPISPGDRFLLYTDGVTEPENARGDAFGDARLEQIVRANCERSASDLSAQLLSELRLWQPDPATQKDDITLLVVDVV